MLSPDIPYPRWIVAGASQTLTFPVYEGAALVAPASGTFSLLGMDGSELVSGAVTVSSSVATYALPAQDETLGTGYLEVWSLVFSGITHRMVRDAALVRRELYPVLNDTALTTVHPALKKRLLATGVTSYQAQRDEAWSQIMLRLMEDGRYPYLILSPWSLRTVHLYLTLHLLYDGGGSDFTAQAATYLERYEQEWKRLSLTYDTSNDEVVDAGEVQSSQRPSRYNAVQVSDRIRRPI